MIGLGELTYENLTSSDRTQLYPWLTWLMYLLATFVILIIFMNMLIAIMGQTFNRVTE